MFRSLLIVIWATSLSACSTAPGTACRDALPEALLAPEPPLAPPDAIRAPLSLRDAYRLWLDDIVRFEALRARHADLAAAARSCRNEEAPPEA